MATRSGAAEEPAPSTNPAPEKVRIETIASGKDFWHEVTTEVFRKSIDVEVRAGLVKLKMSIVRIVMSARMARDLVKTILSHLEPEDQWEVILEQAEELESRGIYRPRR